MQKYNYSYYIKHNYIRIINRNLMRTQITISSEIRNIHKLNSLIKYLVLIFRVYYHQHFNKCEIVHAIDREADYL